MSGKYRQARIEAIRGSRVIPIKPACGLQIRPASSVTTGGHRNQRKQTIDNLLWPASILSCAIT